MALSRIKNEYITAMEASKLFGDFLDSTVDGSNLTGIEGIDLQSRHNLALNYLSDNVRSNLDTLKIEQGWVDTFKDESDVDGYVTPSTGNASDYESKVNLTLFDGASDKLQKNDSGLTDSTKFTISFWFHPTASKDSSAFTIVSTTNARFQIARRNSGVLEATFRDSSGTTLWDWDTASTNFKSTDGLQHILIGMDLNNGIGKVYANGVEQSISSGETKTTGVVDITNSTFTIGNNTGGSDGMPASIGQFFVHNDYIDLSVQANRELFYKDGPVFLGANGENPFGTSAMIYLNNMYDGFQNNSGTGGNFSVTGELVYGGEIATGKGEFKYSVPDDNFTNSSEIIDSHGKEHYSSIVDLQSAFSSSNAQANIISLPDCVITGLSVYGKARTSADGNVFAFIRGIASGTIAGNDAVPDENIIATSTKTVSSLPTSLSVIHFDFPEPVVLTAGEYAIGTECTSTVGGFDRATTRSSNYSGGGGSDTIDADTFHAIRLNASGWINTSTTSPPFSDNAHQNQPFYLYGQKNLDLITKGSDDIGNSPSTAPEKGHMEVLLTERPAGGTSTFSDTLSTNSSNVNNYTYRQILQASDLSVSGDRIRVTLESGTGTQGCKIDNVAIVERAGNTENGVTIPKEILFGGTQGCFIPSNNSSIVSDWTDFKLDSTKDYLLIMDFGIDSSNDNIRWATTGGAGTYSLFQVNPTKSYNTAAMDLKQSANVVNFESGKTVGVNKLEVETQQTLNTDIIAEMSRDGGTTYSPVTLSRKKTNISNINYNLLVGEADFNGDPSGTNIVGRVRTANKDKNTIHGISVNWISE